MESECISGKLYVSPFISVVEKALGRDAAAWTVRLRGSTVTMVGLKTLIRTGLFEPPF